MEAWKGNGADGKCAHCGSPLQDCMQIMVVNCSVEPVVEGKSGMNLNGVSCRIDTI